MPIEQREFQQQKTVAPQDDGALDQKRTKRFSNTPDEHDEVCEIHRKSEALSQHLNSCHDAAYAGVKDLVEAKGFIVKSIDGKKQFLRSYPADQLEPKAREYVDGMLKDMLARQGGDEGAVVALVNTKPDFLIAKLHGLEAVLADSQNPQQIAKAVDGARNAISAIRQGDGLQAKREALTDFFNHMFALYVVEAQRAIVNSQADLEKTVQAVEKVKVVADERFKPIRDRLFLQQGYQHACREKVLRFARHPIDLRPEQTREEIYRHAMDDARFREVYDAFADVAKIFSADRHNLPVEHFQLALDLKINRSSINNANLIRDLKKNHWWAYLLFDMENKPRVDLDGKPFSIDELFRRGERSFMPENEMVAWYNARKKGLAQQQTSEERKAFDDATVMQYFQLREQIDNERGLMEHPEYVSELLKSCLGEGISELTKTDGMDSMGMKRMLLLTANPALYVIARKKFTENDKTVDLHQVLDEFEHPINTLQTKLEGTILSLPGMYDPARFTDIVQSYIGFCSTYSRILDENEKSMQEFYGESNDQCKKAHGRGLTLPFDKLRVKPYMTD
jgi:hypothetical protein